MVSPYAVNRPTGGVSAGTTFAAESRPVATTDGSSAIARKPANPYRRTQSARKPQHGVQQQIHR
jgi:hypothetical protein